MRVWVTRTRPGADATASRLEAMGHEALIAPLLEIEPVDGPINLDGVGALAFTSLSGLGVFAARRAGRDLPVFAVGDATAAAARTAGFTRVTSAAGAVEDLARTIADHHDGTAGDVLWAGAEAPAGDLPGLLAARGITLRSTVLYRSTPTPRADLAAALANGRIDAVLVHSPRAAMVLAPLLPPGPLPARLVAISAAAAAPLAASGFRKVAVAERPDESALLAALGKPGPRV